MKNGIYTIYDDKAKTYHNPFYNSNDQVAIRNFSNEVNSDPASSQIAANPEDFILFGLGEFDTDTGIFKAYTPVMLTGASNLIQGEKK